MAGVSSGLSAHHLAEGDPDARHPFPSARHPAVRCEIARFRELTGMQAGRYGIGAETIHKR
jgi:hypothetical protein